MGGLNIHSVSLLEGLPDASKVEYQVSMGNGTDPYQGAYNALAPSKGSGDLSIAHAGSSPLHLLPPMAIIGIAAGVVVLGTAFALLVWFRRRQMRREPHVAVGKSVAEPSSEKVGKTVDEANSEKIKGNDDAPVKEPAVPEEKVATDEGSHAADQGEKEQVIQQSF